MHNSGALALHPQGLFVAHSKCAFVCEGRTKNGAFLLGVVV